MTTLIESMKKALKDYPIVEIVEYINNTTHKNSVVVALDDDKIHDNKLDYEEFLNAIINATGEYPHLAKIVNLCRGDVDSVWNCDSYTKNHKIQDINIDGDFLLVVDLEF